MRDRKSTRLNSSHLVTSYADFCLKKKTIEQLTVTTLGNITGPLTLEEPLTSRDQVNDRLRVVPAERTCTRSLHDALPICGVHSSVKCAFAGCSAFHSVNQAGGVAAKYARSEEHTSELQSPCNLVCRLLLEKKNHRAAHGDHARQHHRPADLGGAAHQPRPGQRSASRRARRAHLHSVPTRRSSDLRRPLVGEVRLRRVLGVPLGQPGRRRGREVC